MYKGRLLVDIRGEKTLTLALNLKSDDIHILLQELRNSFNDIGVFFGCGNLILETRIKNVLSRMSSNSFIYSFFF